MGTKCHIPMILKLEGQQKVWIMTDDDLNDTWSTLSKGTGSLWWYGVRKLARVHLPLRTKKTPES